MRILILIFSLSLSNSQNAFSHGGKSGSHHNPLKSLQTEDTKFQKINDSFNRKVKPIFEKKCFDCHGGTTHYPWYYMIPGAGHLIDQDIHEAKEHLDMSKGFPFSGHGSPEEDLTAITETVESGDMPPFRYKILHPKSGLNEDEKSLVKAWIRESQKELEDKAGKK